MSQINNPIPGRLQGLVLILPITLAVMGVALLAPIVPRLMETFEGLENARILVPILLPLPALCIALFAPLAGWVADRTSRRKLLIFSMFCYGFFGVAPIVLDSYWAIFATRVGVGICEAFIVTCSTALLSDYFSGAERDKWLGSQAAVSSLSAMFLFPLGGFLGSAFGWRGPFAVYAVAFVLMALVMLFTWDQRRDETQTAQNQSAKLLQTAVFPWAHMFKVCLLTLVGGICFYVIALQLSTALGQFDIDNPAVSGILLSIAHLGVPIGALAYRFAHRKFSLKNLVALEFVIIGVGFVGMSLAPNAPLFMLASFINQIGAGLMLPTMLTWAVAPLAFSIRGRGTGMWQSTFAFAQFASTLVFAGVLSWVGEANYMDSFYVFAAMALAVAAFAFFLLKRNPLVAAAEREVVGGG